MAGVEGEGKGKKPACEGDFFAVKSVGANVLSYFLFLFFTWEYYLMICRLTLRGRVLIVSI